MLREDVSEFGSSERFISKMWRSVQFSSRSLERDWIHTWPLGENLGFFHALPSLVQGESGFCGTLVYSAAVDENLIQELEASPVVPELLKHMNPDNFWLEVASSKGDTLSTVHAKQYHHRNMVLIGDAAHGK